MIEEDFTFNSSIDGTGPLLARAFYNPVCHTLPLMVVQHGYLGSRLDVAYSARRIAENGFFCIAVDTRGWGGSEGRHDDGGVEIMDIYDGIEAAKSRYVNMVDCDRISIIGYSNGGANVFFSVVRFPFTFCAAMALFGISDYGQWIDMVDGTLELIIAEIRSSILTAIGGTRQQVPDKYLVRNANMAANNLSGTRFHIAYDETEIRCPPIMNKCFMDAVHGSQRDHVFLHVSGPADLNRWIHDYNYGHLNAIEDIYMADIKTHDLPVPLMPASGKLVILGFIVTPRFISMLGSGEDTAAKVSYHFEHDKAILTFSPLSSIPTALAKVILMPDQFTNPNVQLKIDGQFQTVLDNRTKQTIICTISSRIELSCSL
jgi:pimeloyl-ACP methyl ester carboxylesterase